MSRCLKIMIVLCATLIAGDAVAQGNAGQAGEFLRWGIGAKALGMGRAFTSIADDASAMYWNPAGMTALPRIGGTMMFMHLPLREGASVNYLAGAMPMRLFFTQRKNPGPFIRAFQDLKFGLGVIWHSLGDFEFFNDIADKIGSDNGSIGESAVYFSASYPLNSAFRKIKPGSRLGWTRFLRGNLELGVTAKFVRQDLFGENGSATSFDVGLKYSHISGLFNAGFVLRDVNSATISFDQLVGDEIPKNGVLGVSLVPPFGRLHGLLLSLDYGVVTPAGRDRDVMVGLEYDFSVIDARVPVKLRLGSNSNQEAFTFGLHFSPEALWNQDWAPSADWAYASERSRFDAVGARYSFSVDRNPFTARYWYSAAMALFPDVSCLDTDFLPHAGEVSRSLKNAMSAKNPGKRAFRYEAALRSADIAFLRELQVLQDSKQANDFSPQNAIKRFSDVTRRYDGRGHRYLVMDYGKLELDREQYFRSLLYFVQTLVLSGKQDLAAVISAERGRSWGRKLPVLASSDTTRRRRQEQALDYLRAYALYADGREDDALEVIGSSLDGMNVGRFLQGHIHFLRREYAASLTSLSDLDLNYAEFPESLHLPITSDCSFGDEVLFLRAASMYRLSDPEFVNEFAKIPRFFPNSDLARFITNGNTIMKRLLEYQKKEQHDKVNELVSKMVESYLKTFSNGTLIEELYTMNYR